MLYWAFEIPDLPCQPQSTPTFSKIDDFFTYPKTLNPKCSRNIFDAEPTLLPNWTWKKHVCKKTTFWGVVPFWVKSIYHIIILLIITRTIPLNSYWYPIKSLRFLVRHFLTTRIGLGEPATLDLVCLRMGYYRIHGLFKKSCQTKLAKQKKNPHKCQNRSVKHVSKQKLQQKCQQKSVQQVLRVKVPTKNTLKHISNHHFPLKQRAMCGSIPQRHPVSPHHWGDLPEICTLQRL